MTSLQQAVLRAGGKVSVLKMDCEGAEWEILKHARHVLACIPEIRMEYHLTAGHTLDEFIEVAGGTGHRITRLTNNGNHGIAWLSAS